MAGFYIPRSPSSPLLCGSDVVRRCMSHPYATAVCLALRECLMSPCQNCSPGDSQALEKERNSLIDQKQRKGNEKALEKHKFEASCCREPQKVLLLFVPKWLLLVTENTCLLLFGFRHRVPTCLRCEEPLIERTSGFCA